MTHETMTLHRALSELKTLDARVVKAIGEGTYVTTNKHSNEKINGMTVKDFTETMKASYQKVDDLIRRRNAIKRAVVLSNAVTKVTIGGTEYTVAEAIELKNHGMELKQRFLNTLTSQHMRAQNMLASNSGEAIERNAERYILYVIQSQPKDSKMTVDSDAIKSLKKDYITDNTHDLIDPLKVTKIMEELDKEINDFMTEIDSTLSTSNALTVIEIEY